jgi:hypothetical protein
MQGSASHAFHEQPRSRNDARDHQEVGKPETGNKHHAPPPLVCLNVAKGPGHAGICSSFFGFGKEK